MRVVVLCSSPYSETGCALAAALAQGGRPPVGAITLPAADRKTLIRKLGQWGPRGVLRYAWGKLSPSSARAEAYVRNEYLGKSLRTGESLLRNLHDVAREYDFPVLTVRQQNSPAAVQKIKEWAADAAIFTGGDILRAEMIQAPRLGVINTHLALLPEIRGMSSPEWSLLCGVPLGITVHKMDTGIDTGPVFLRREFDDAGGSKSLTDLRNRLIAHGMQLVMEVLAGLEQGTMTAVPQPAVGRDTQYFVMHERLKAVAARRLHSGSMVRKG
jgi:folate-dependent phosphoribosylglycinamide formyltransferase PurN